VLIGRHDHQLSSNFGTVGHLHHQDRKRDLELIAWHFAGWYWNLERFSAGTFNLHRLSCSHALRHRSMLQWWGPKPETSLLSWFGILRKRNCNWSVRPLDTHDAQLVLWIILARYRVSDILRQGCLRFEDCSDGLARDRLYIGQITIFVAVGEIIVGLELLMLVVIWEPPP
jgi:hypothetical protein